MKTTWVALLLLGLLCGAAFGKIVSNPQALFRKVRQNPSLWTYKNTNVAPPKPNVNAKTTQWISEVHKCVGGKDYKLRYNVTVSDDNSYIQLENVPGLVQVACNVDDTFLLLAFDDNDDLSSFINQLVVVDGFVTAGSELGCNNLPLIRRILDFAPLDDQTLVLHALPTKYDEIFQTADISYGPSGNNASSACADENICLGINANNDCTSAEQPLPIYQNEYVRITCSDCFLGLTADVFLDINMDWFALTSFSGGFKNINILGALVLDLLATYSWSAGSDKTLPIINPTTIVEFWIGPIPIRIWFQIPLQQIANAEFHATAEATVGAEFDWNLGDWTVSWDWEDGWTTQSINPQFSWTPVISGSASFDAGAQLALVPSFQANVDNFYSVTFTLNPEFYLNANGSTTTGQLCASMDYGVDVTVTSELYINIPWFALHDQYTWGPEVLYDSGKQYIGNFCVQV